MTQPSPSDQHRRADHAHSSYRERLTVSWWLWPVGLGIAATIVAELAIGAAVLGQWYGFVAAFVVTAATLFWAGRVRVEVSHDELRVDDARLPIQLISAVATIDMTARRDLLGVDADPLAFVVQRPWIGGGVRVDLADPADPTPYWYVSSRHPDQLADALRAAQLATPR